MEVVVLMGVELGVLMVVWVVLAVMESGVLTETGSKRVYDTIPSSLHPLLLLPSPLLLQLLLLLRGHVSVR